MRLFTALDIDDEIRQRIGRFVDGVSGFAPDARWVRLESIHITLKFIGEQPPEILPTLQSKLNGVSVPPIQLNFAGFGFFPTPKSPRVFWIGIQAAPELQRLAAAIDEATAQLGIPKEDRAVQPSPDTGPQKRRLGRAPPPEGRRPQPGLPAPAREIGNNAARRSLVP